MSERVKEMGKNVITLVCYWSAERLLNETVLQMDLADAPDIVLIELKGVQSFLKAEITRLETEVFDKGNFGEVETNKTTI